MKTAPMKVLTVRVPEDLLKRIPGEKAAFIRKAIEEKLKRQERKK